MILLWYITINIVQIYNSLIRNNNIYKCIATKYVLGRAHPLKLAQRNNEA